MDKNTLSLATVFGFKTITKSFYYLFCALKKKNPLYDEKSPNRGVIILYLPNKLTLN